MSKFEAIRPLDAEARWLSVAHYLPDIILIVDRDSRIRYINHPPAGIEAESVQGTLLVDAVLPEHRERLLESIDEVFTSGRPGFNEVRAVGPNRTSAWYASQIGPIPQTGPVQAVILIARDVTEQKEREEEQRQAEARWRSLVENAPDMVVMLNRDLEILFINRTAPGITPEEALGRSVLEFVPTNNREMVEQEIRRVFETGEPTRYETAVVVEPGNTLWYATRVGAIQKEGRVEQVVLLTSDITRERRLKAERQRLRQRLQQAQRMEAIGSVAGGIAHDFNNILCTIGMQTELARIELGDDQGLASAREPLDEISQLLRRSRELISHILLFSKGGEQVETETLDLRALASESIAELRSTLTATIDVQVDVGGVALPVDVNLVRFRQLMLNLCVNARDAMKGEGSLRIAVAPFSPDNSFCASCHTQVAGEYSRLSVSDDGCGISPERQHSIFEPFFTSKKRGEGAGIGLSVVHGVVHDADGHILIDSKPGEGTTFHLLFPRTAAPPRRAPVIQPAVARNTDQDKIRLLLVDDEVALLRSVSILLKRQGFAITSFDDPRKALQHLLDTSESYDVLVTDQVMPGMTGVQLVHAARKALPSLPAVLCSGYSSDVDAGNAAQFGLQGYLAKPYSVDEFVRAVRQAVKVQPSTRPTAAESRPEP